jgi:hypothetical protein
MRRFRSVFLCFALLPLVAACQSKSTKEEIAYFAAAAPKSDLPPDWLAPDHYACLKSYHLHSGLLPDYPAVAAACRWPAQGGWAPASAAMGATYLAARQFGDPSVLAPLGAREAESYLIQAAEAGEPLAKSLLGGERGGAAGRALVKQAIAQGQGAGLMTLLTNQGRPVETNADREDMYWAAVVGLTIMPLATQSIRREFESGPDALPDDTRSRLLAEAREVRMGPQAATPVSPMVMYDMRAAVTLRHPYSPKAGPAPIMLRLHRENLFNRLNAGLALVLSDDPEVIQGVHTNLENLAAVAARIK